LMAAMSSPSATIYRDAVRRRHGRRDRVRALAKPYADILDGHAFLAARVSGFDPVVCYRTDPACAWSSRSHVRELGKKIQTYRGWRLRTIGRSRGAGRSGLGSRSRDDCLDPSSASSSAFKTCQFSPCRSWSSLRRFLTPCFNNATTRKRLASRIVTNRPPMSQVLRSGRASPFLAAALNQKWESRD
jgi:hypothetical protein